MKISSFCTFLVMAIACSIHSSVFAQYVWLDDNGHKQYSDQAPPPSVPKNKILKLKGKSVDDSDLTSYTPASTTSTDQKVKQPQNLADQELAYKKRQAELAEKIKKEDAEAKEAATKSENCKRLKNYKQGLESGMRVSQINPDGTTGYLTDEKRAEELKAADQSLSECGN